MTCTVLKTTSSHAAPRPERRRELRRYACAALLALLAGCVAVPPAEQAPSPPVGPQPPSPAPPSAPPPELPPSLPPTQAATPSPPAEVADSEVGVLVGRGLASWYGGQLHGRRTASGERFDREDFTAAHRTLPFGARLCVRSMVNGKAVVVRVNDRGPFVPGRVIDLSQAAAEELGMTGLGIKQVELWHLGEAENACPEGLPGLGEADVSGRPDRSVSERQRSARPKGKGRARGRRR